MADGSFAAHAGFASSGVQNARQTMSTLAKSSARQTPRSNSRFV